MSKKLKFRDCFHVEIIESEAVFLLSEIRSHILNGAMDQLLAPLINAQMDTDEIIDHILETLIDPDSFNPNSPQNFLERVVQASTPVYQALTLMQQKGYVVEKSSDTPLSNQLISLADALNLRVEQVSQRLNSLAVVVKSIGESKQEESILTELLESMQIQVLGEDSSDQDSLRVVLAHDYLCEDLVQINQAALRFNQPWLLIKPVGSTIWLGPLFDPGKTACWECLAHRLQINRPINAYLERRKKVRVTTPPDCMTHSTLQTALGLAATEVLKWVVQGKNQQLYNRIITIDLLSLQTHHHMVVRRPQCPCCGDPTLYQRQQKAPFILGNRKKKFTIDGGHRALTPQETIEKYRHHLSPITGIVRQMVSIAPPSNQLIHVYGVQHHFMRMFDDLEGLYQNLSGNSAGKGKTAWQAKASGFCEAIERYSGVYQGDELRIESSYRALGSNAIHPNSCMNFSQDQYKHRYAWNQQYRGISQRVPEPFDETQEIEWTPLWSLSDQTFRYLPTAYCYFGYPKPSKPDCWADANGCAAGNTLEEAILHGFMELVERDSAALWWYNRLQRPKVDLSSFNDPYADDLQSYYASLHRDLWVLDISSDLRIPSFAAVSQRRDHGTEDIILGFGTHLDPHIALSRALTEMNQALVSVFASTPEGKTRYPESADSLAVKWWTTAKIQDHPYLIADQKLPLRVRSDYSLSWSDNLFEDIKFCQEIVEGKGMKMLVLDQSRPDVGLKVVKVVVPGLCHIWRRLGARRLYSIPVEMGWLSQPLNEDQLNPFPLWM